MSSRTLHFPDRVVGTVQISSGTLATAVDAVGDVSLDAAATAVLVIAPDGLRDASWLNALPPDGLYALVAPAPVEVTDDAAEALQRLTGLQALVLESSSLSADGVEALGALSELTGLALGVVGDLDLRVLAKFETLRALSLRAPGTVTGRARLSALTRLEELALELPMVGDEGLEPIGPLPALRSFVLEAGALKGAGLRFLRDCPSLETVVLHTPMLDQEGVGHVGAVGTLRSADLQRVPFDDAMVAALASASLADLTVASLPAGFDATGLLARLPSLSQLVVAEGIESEQAMTLHRERPGVVVNGVQYTAAALARLARSA